VRYSSLSFPPRREYRSLSPPKAYDGDFSGDPYNDLDYTSPDTPSVVEEIPISPSPDQFVPKTPEEALPEETPLASPARPVMSSSSGDSDDSAFGPWKMPRPSDPVFIDTRRNTVIFVKENGNRLTYDSFQIQTDNFQWRPRYRFRVLDGALAHSKVKTSILPAREAFDDFGRWAHKNSTLVPAQVVFQPHNRAFSLLLEKDEFCGHFISLVGSYLSPVPLSKKIE